MNLLEPVSSEPDLNVRIRDAVSVVLFRLARKFIDFLRRLSDRLEEDCDEDEFLPLDTGAFFSTSVHSFRLINWKDSLLLNASARLRLPLLIWSLHIGKEVSLLSDRGSILFSLTSLWKLTRECATRRSTMLAHSFPLLWSRYAINVFS